jgi:hypothetical protein
MNILIYQKQGEDFILLGEHICADKEEGTAFMENLRLSTKKELRFEDVTKGLVIQKKKRDFWGAIKKPFVCVLGFLRKT